MRHRILLIGLFVSLSVQAWDWWPLPLAEEDVEKDSLFYQAEATLTAGSGRFNAFWLLSRQGALASIAPYNGALRLSVEKPATRPHRWFDYDFAIDMQLSAHSAMPVQEALRSKARFPVYQANHGTFVIHRLYAHARLYIVDVSAGVMPMTDGMDTPLGSGSLLLSANAPSMPAVRIGLEQWTPFPGLFGYMEIKGGLAHAWLTDNIGVYNSMLHYKWAGLQLGGSLPVNISYEIHHAAQWGGKALDGKDLGNNWRAFRHVLLAQAGGESYNEAKNAQGNHLGSQLLTLTAKGTGWKTKIYWQNFLEDNFAFIGNGKNLPDGRWGITAEQQVWPFLNTVTVEYIGTTDQSGPLHDQDGIIYAGNDEYYRNSVYSQGWNYFLRSLGSPLITSPLYNLQEDTQTRNNRIKAWHIGIGGDIFGFRYKMMATYVRNYGTYRYDDWFTQKSTNTALLLQLNKQVEKAWGLEFGLCLAADIGTQFGNTFSAQVTIRKQGLITQW